MEGLGLREMALEVSVDVEHRFDLAIQLKRLDVAYEIARDSENESKWKQVADFALAEWKVRWPRILWWRVVYFRVP